MNIFLKGYWMQHDYWFNEKVLGWGFGLPLTLEGWLAYIGLFSMFALSGYYNDIFKKRDKKDFAFLWSKNMARFVFDLVVLVAVFTLSFHDKVKGGIVWHW